MSALNDVFVVLLMIFMAPQLKIDATAPSAVIEIEASKNDQKNTALDKEGDDIPRLNVHISANGFLDLDHHSVTIVDIEKAAKRKEVSTIRLEIDEHTPYSVIQKISRELSDMGYVLELG